MGNQVLSGWDSYDQEVKKIEDGRFDFDLLRNDFDSFQLEKDASAKIVFLSKAPVIRYEHTYVAHTAKGKRINTLACIGDDCPLCEAYVKDGPISKRRLMAYFTVLLLGKFKPYGKDELTNPVLAYPATQGTMEKLKFFAQENDGSLEFLGMTVKRSREQMAPRVGDIFSVGKRLTREEVQGHNRDAKPIDFEKVLKPLTRKDVLNFLNFQRRSSAPAPSESNDDWGTPAPAAATEQPAPSAGNEPGNTISW